MFIFVLIILFGISIYLREYKLKIKVVFNNFLILIVFVIFIEIIFYYLYLLKLLVVNYKNVSMWVFF